MAVEPAPSPLVVQVRAGELVSSSWVYAWVQMPTGGVLHVGSTGLPPQVRTWLHLHGGDPGVARVASRHPGALGGAYDVVAFEVPAGLDRAVVKRALVAALSVAGLLSQDWVGDPPEVPPGAQESADDGVLAQQVAAMVASIAAT